MVDLDGATTDDDDSMDLGSMVTGEGDGDSGGGSGGSRGGGSRTTVMVKGLYGTDQYPPDTTCHKCGTRAVGVLVMEKRLGEKVTKTGRPMCSRHRDVFKKSNTASWEEFEFRRFVD